MDTRIIINTGHLKLSLVLAGRKILPKRLVVAVKKYLPYRGGGVLDHPYHNYK